MKKQIFCDIDSTIHPYNKLLESAITELYGDIISANIRITIENLSPTQLAQAISITNSNEYLEQITPYPGAVETLNMYMENGYKIFFISGREKQIKDRLKDSLCRIGIKNEFSIFCVGENLSLDNNETEKIRIANMLAGRQPCLFIDDNPIVIEKCHFSPYLIPATIIQQWNKEVVNKYGICSATTWKKLAKKLNQEYGLPLDYGRKQNTREIHNKSN